VEGRGLGGTMEQRHQTTSTGLRAWPVVPPSLVGRPSEFVIFSTFSSCRPHTAYFDERVRTCEGQFLTVPSSCTLVRSPHHTHASEGGGVEMERPLGYIGVVVVCARVCQRAPWPWRCIKTT